MSEDPHHTTPESDSEPLRATRRTALQGAGLASLLALGGASATAQKDFLRSNALQDQNETSADDESVPVTWENFPRASCHAGFQSTVDAGGFGQFYHMRDLAPSRISSFPGSVVIFSTRGGYSI
jgi:hypothetical protein